MKRIKEIKSGTKKQIMSGLVYVALAVTVVSVTIGSVVSSFSDNGDTVEKENQGNTPNKDDYNLKIPEANTENDINIGDFSLDTPVSDSPLGINAEIVIPEAVTETDNTATLTTENVIGNAHVAIPESEAPADDSTVSADKTKPISEEPDEAVFEYGFDGFIKPCQGYISKEFSVDIPVYSVSMYDYRTHNGIDIVGEIGTPVKATSNGVIADVYNDYLYGTTVVIEHKDGIISVYSNLSPDLPVDTVKGRAVISGEIIGGIGESAACEASEAKHLHFEMMKNGEYVDPSEYFVN